MSSTHAAEPKNFEPKKPVQLDPPKSDPISVEDLAKCDGKVSGGPSNAIPGGSKLMASCDSRYGLEPSDIGGDQGHRLRRQR